LGTIIPARSVATQWLTPATPSSAASATSIVAIDANATSGAPHRQLHRVGAEGIPAVGLALALALHGLEHRTT